MILFRLNGYNKLLSNITIDFGKPKVSKVLWEQLTVGCFRKQTLDLSWILQHPQEYSQKIQINHLSESCVAAAGHPELLCV